MKFSTTHLRYYLFCGLTGIAIPNSMIYFSAAHLPAGLLALIVNIVPVIVYPLALCLRLEVFQWTRLLGVGSAILGLMFIILPEASLPSAASIPWVLVALGAPLSFAICAVYISLYRPEESSSMAQAAGTLITASLFLAPLVIATGNFYHFHFPFNLPDWVIVLEMILSSLGYVLFFLLLKIAGPVYYSLLDAVVAITGLFWGSILFHERLNLWTTAAVLLILLALFLVTKPQRVVTSEAKGVIC